MKTLQEHYTAIKNGKGNKAQFLKQARQLFPQYFNQYTDFNTATNVLKSKQIINEAAGGVVSKGFDIWDWKKILAEEKELKTGDILKHKSTGAEFKITKISGNNIEGKYTKLGDMEGKVKIGDTNKTNKNLIGKTYELISESVKAVEKNVSKEVEDVYKHAYDNKDMKNADNINFNEIMKGFYCELKDSKNSGKTGDELKDIVVKNLAKDPLYYTKNGEFGVKDLGYTTEAPGLGEPKEPKGKYKSSGYGDIEKAEKVKANVQDSLGDKEAKTSMPKKVKEMPVTPQNSSGVKKMPMPGVEKKIKLKEGIGMFHDPIGYKKSEPSDLDKMFTKKYKGNGMYVIYKNGEEVKTIEGEGNANAWINNEKIKLKEAVYQGTSVGPGKGGSGGGKRFIPNVTTLSKDAVDVINTAGEKRMGWNKKHIKIVKSGENNIKLLISKLLLDAIVGSQRGKTQSGPTKGRTLQGTGLTSEETGKLSGEFKKLVKTLNANEKLTPNGDYFLLNVDTKFNEKRNQYEMPLPNQITESILRSLIREIINEELDNDGFQQWKEELYNLVMKEANMEKDEISIDDKEIQEYYNEGKTPSEVYFDIWQQDAGNFFNIPL